MSKYEIDEDFEECEMEAFWDGLDHHWAEMRNEVDPYTLWTEEERAEISESVRWNDYMDMWGELDPLAAGFVTKRREGA